MDREELYAGRDILRRAVSRRRVRLMRQIALCAVAVAGLAASSCGATQRSAPSGSTTQTGAGAGPAGGSQSKPAASSTGTPGTQPVPILMYHVIAAPPAGAPFPGLYVPPAEFAEQMQALKGAGWHAVTLDQVAANWRTGASLGGGKPIVLTFDNGYQSQFTQALPVLQRLGWVGTENIQLSGLPPSQGGLGEAQVRGLIAAGWELDTQGFSHADLITLSPERLHYEVAVTRSVLQHKYRVPVNWFCYPSGHYDPAVIAEVRAAGYMGSTTVVPGWAHRSDDAYRLHRLRVLGGTSGPALLEQVASTRVAAAAPSAYSGG
ncbi:MAG TPA: polysaccharide deacetylase family protein [Solirubrobacteraceae bacterium]|nr:polysaccharide deacetylase family protein [Solirubrobacteraceae bacterium]